MNDEGRELFTQYLLDKIELFDFLCDFELKKDWLETPPLMGGS